VRRRAFIAALGSAAAWPMVARAQSQHSVPVIGFLSGDSSSNAPFLNVFRDALKNAGYIEQQNVAIEFRSAEGQYDKLPAIAADLVSRKVSVIATDGAVSAPLAAKQATTTIPIVFFTGSDPVRWGLVASLNRPGGNITGVTISSSELMAKRVELLRELVPDAAVIGLLVNPNNPNAEPESTDIAAIAQTGGWTLKVVKATSEQELEAAFADLVRSQAGGVITATDAVLASWYQQIAALGVRYKLPVIQFGRQSPRAGGLISYGSRVGDLYRLFGDYTARVLKGNKPADLPVYYPTKFDLVINLKTAKALGLTIPPLVLARADEVIE
jgi:putative ABC transport system substrate-binding protein